jgi:SET domain-containing protein
VVTQGSSVRLEVFYTGKNRGWGIRTLCEVPARTFVCNYHGEYVRTSSVAQRGDRYSAGTTYVFDLPCGIHSIDATECGNVGRFANHSCDPNMRPVPVHTGHNSKCFPLLAFFTTRAVRPGEEMTFDYFPNQQKSDPLHSLEVCWCASVRCRWPAPEAAEARAYAC